MIAKTIQFETLAALEALVCHPDFERLGALVCQPRPFNLFEAVGLARQELRHSDLLAFLLDSHRPHGMGVTFVRALLHRTATLSIQPFDPDALHLEGLDVQREWNFIDILIESPIDHLAIIIENKIDTSEHSDQLGRYYRLVSKHRPGWRIIGIYLTLDGTPPASATDRERYIPLSYADIAAILQDLAATPQATLDVQILLRHYAQLIRSELVPEPNADQALLGRRLYMEHRAAIDAILQARDARMRMVQRFFDGLFTATLHEQPDVLRLDQPYADSRRPRWHTRFAPPVWYKPKLQVSTPWNKTRLLILFQFMHGPRQIHFDLVVGPAPGAEDLRRAFYDLALQRTGGLFPAWSNPTNDFFSIYARQVFEDGSDYFAEASDEAIRVAIRDHWHAFLRDDLPGMMEVVRASMLEE